MFQLAQQKQRRIDHSYRAPAIQHEPAHAPGKQALTDSLHARHLGEPDYYNRTVDNALRELDAIRKTALPSFVAVRRNKDLEPLAKQIELAKSAMQVRHMILTANAHVYLLEQSETYKNPMVALLRQRIDRVVTRATKLGVYDGALDMRPRAYSDKDILKINSCQIALSLSPTGARTKPKAPGMLPTLAAGTARANPKAGNTPTGRLPRVARGTSAPPTRNVPAPSARIATPAVAPVRTPVQRKSSGASAGANVQAVAAQGVASASTQLPFASVIQRAFGRHDISSVRVQIGGAAQKASVQLGAKAYATGNLIAFAHEPDLHTAAHEAAHIIQQRRGISLAGEVDDGPSDTYERHADAVADAVVAGKSVEHMFDTDGYSASTAPVVQRKSDEGAAKPKQGFDLYMSIHEVDIRRAISAQLADTAWPEPSADLNWQPGGERQFARHLAAQIATRVAASGFRKLVYPAKVDVALTHVTARSVWSPEFGETLAFQVERAAIASLRDRIGPQYRDLVASRVELPTAGDIVSTHAIDALVARALTQRGVVDVTNVAVTAPTQASPSKTTKGGKAEKKPAPPSLQQLLDVEKSITRVLDAVRADIRPYSLADKLVPAYEVLARRVPTLVDGDESTRARFAPAIQFQHTQLLTIQPRITAVATQLAQKKEDKALKRRLELYVRAAAVSDARDASTAILRAVVAEEQDAIHEAFAQQTIELRGATRGAVASQERADKATGEAEERLERQRRAALLGTTATQYDVQKAVTLAGEVALKNRIVAVSKSLDQLRIAAEQAGCADVTALRRLVPGVKGIGELIADVNAHLEDVNRSWDRAIREHTPAVKTDASAPSDWADWQGRTAGLADAQRAFTRIAGDQSISKFVHETQKKIRHEALLNAIRSFALNILLTVTTGMGAAMLGRAASAAIAGEALWTRGLALVADVAINTSINSVVQMALGTGGTPAAFIAAENILMELFTRGMAAGVHSLQKAALAETRALAQLPHLSAAERQLFSSMRFTGVDLSVELLSGPAAQWAAHKVVSLAKTQLATDKGDASRKSAKSPDDPELAAIAVQQGASIALGKYFHGRYHMWKQHRAQLSKSSLAAKPETKALFEAREQFFQEAKRLSESISPEPEAGLALAERDTALIRQEQQVVTGVTPAIADTAATTLSQLAPPTEVMFGSHQRSRAEHFLTQMSPEQRTDFTAILDATSDPVAKAFLFKGLAAGNSHADLRWLSGEMAGKSRGWLIDNLTLGDPRGVGGGLAQQWQDSCNAAMTVTLRGNMDPVFALRARQQNPAVGSFEPNNPFTLNAHQANVERQWLESPYSGVNPGSPVAHQGVAVSRGVGRGGTGRYADDLLNALSSSTGVSYSPIVRPTRTQVLATLDLSLAAGMQVPLVIGHFANPQAHYVLVQDRRVVGGQPEYNVHDPWTGESNWMAEADVQQGAFPAPYDSVGTIEVPTGNLP